jgi:hypothetical protein
LARRAWAAFICVFGGWRAAAGNGRDPAAVSFVSAGPGRLLVGTTFGLVRSSDGATWQWICEASIYSGSEFGVFDPRYAVSPSGAIFAALPTGVAVTRDGGCSWRGAAGSIVGQWASDVAPSPVDARTIYAVTATTGAPNGLHISRDDGATWSAVGASDPIAAYRRVVPMGADALLSGFDAVGGGHARIWRYDGAAGRVLAQPGHELELLGPVADYIGVDESGAAYLKGRGGDVDVLLRTSDGGATFTEIYRSSSIAAAVLGARDEVWLATERGLVQAPDGVTFGGPRRPDLWTCLGFGASWLYGCTTRRNETVARTHDGDGWARTLDLRANLTGALSCPAGSPTHDLCEPLWPSLARQLGIGQGVDAGTSAGGRDAAPTLEDGGGGGSGTMAQPHPNGSHAASPTAGACSASQGHGPAAPPWWIGLLTATVGILRPRTRP